jgi:hypothetical protein
VRTCSAAVFARWTHLYAVSDYYVALDSGRLNEVDPAWIASYFTAILSGYELLDESITHICGRPYAAFEHMTHLWTSAVSLLLGLAQWMSVPQYRTLQCIIFKWHPCSQVMPVSPLWCAFRPRSGCSHPGCRGTLGVRIAQFLNFHMLGDDQRTSPYPLSSPSASRSSSGQCPSIRLVSQRVSIRSSDR